MFLGRYFKSIAFLTAGAALGQLVVLLASPVMTRLFSPADFGELAVFMSILGILGPLATCRFELALVTPEADSEAVRLMQLSLLCCLGLSLLTALLLLLGAADALAFLDVGDLRSHVWVIPPAVLVFGAFQVAVFYSTRQKLFAGVAQARFLQGVGNVGCSICLGLLWQDSLGLLMGYLLGNVIAAVYLISKNPCSPVSCPTRFAGWRECLNIVGRYRRFPLYVTPADLLSSLGLWVPSLALGYLYGPEVAGLFALTQRVIGAPLSMLGQAVGQVYLGLAPGLWRSDRAGFRSIYFTTMRQLGVLGLVAIVPLALLGQEVFAVLFGEVWRQAGDYLRFLAPMFVLQFVVSPLSNTPALIGRQGLMLAVDAFRLISVMAVFGVASYAALSAVQCVMLFGGVSALAYGVYLVAISTAVHRVAHVG